MYLINNKSIYSMTYLFVMRLLCAAKSNLEFLLQQAIPSAAATFAVIKRLKLIARL